jgi:hypothetical protein
MELRRQIRSHCFHNCHRVVILFSFAPLELSFLSRQQTCFSRLVKVTNTVFLTRPFTLWRSLLCGLALACSFSMFAAPRINELMAANDSGLKDEDGDFSDWIEIYNPDATAVSLAGYYLTDNPQNLNKWKFPAVTLNPGAYLVVFASDKDRNNPAGTLHTNFQLDSEGEYLALVAPNKTSILTEFSPAFPPQFENISYGVGGTDSAPVWSLFTTPTPGAVNSTGTPAGPVITVLEKDPAQPVTGPLTIAAQVRPVNGPVAAVNLIYRRMFNVETNIVMHDDGTGGDTNANDGVWTAAIPAGAFGPGEMTRWRLTATDSSARQTKEPAFRNTIDYPQYFGSVAFDSRIESLLPVFHWFTTNLSGSGTETGARGSVYYEGEFYDNVKFNLHGQSTAGFPKKSYNIDFNPHNHFRYKTNAARVSDIDLLTNWADKSKVRQVLAYEIMRGSGVAAHFAFTVRVQQNGNFFSTADFVERGNEEYLERAGLNKDGALYKVYGNTLNKAAGDTGTSGVEKKTRAFENNADLQALINGLALTGTNLSNYIWDNVDIPRCVDMLAANSVIRNIDMHVKNWYIYRDTGRSGEWAILPWDLDLSQGRLWDTQFTYFDNGIYTDGYIITGNAVRLVALMFQNASMRPMIMRRIRTLADQFLQPPPAPGTPENSLYYERRLNEQSALIDPPDIVPSDATRDFQKWGSWLWGGQTVPYTNTDSAVETMAEAIQRFKTEYLSQRRAYIYDTQIVGKGGELPLAQENASSGAEPKIKFGAYEVSPISGNQDQEYIQLLNTNSVAVDISDWHITGGIEHDFVPGTVIPKSGSLYLCPKAEAFRARMVSPKGGQGLFVQGGYRNHLSNLGETVLLLDSSGATNATLTYSGQPSDAQRYLVVSEVMYHPPGDGLAEYIELMNISPSVTLDMTDIHFSQGIEFNFTNSPIKTLAPGARVLVVRDVAAFQAIYGSNLPVAGAFTNNTVLDNSGERLKLDDANNQTILEFTYSDSAPWPTAPDGFGYSLTLIAPETKPDPTLATNWRGSAHLRGSPGTTDALPLPLNPTGDADGNGQPDLLDYALGNNLGAAPIPPSAAVYPSEGGGSVLVFTYPQSIGVDQAAIEVLYSTDLATWLPATAILQPGPPRQLGDGRALMSCSLPLDNNANTQFYLRLRVTPR